MASNDNSAAGFSVQGALLRAWSHRGTGATLLWPASLLYAVLLSLRRWLYQWGLLESQCVDALVIVVGNVMVGGAGKTPTTIEIVRHLTQRNFAVGVVSRGYGRKGSECTEVSSASMPEEVGDEPALVKRMTVAPVFVGRSRADAANALLAAYPKTQIIVCDDGLQHFALYRDLEVCVFDDRGIGNGWLLPAGPLRENWPRKLLARVGQQPKRCLVLHTGGKPTFEGFRATRTLARQALRNDGSTTSLPESLTRNKPLVALAGIAQPQRFFDMLRAAGVTDFESLALPDHYDFNSLSRSVYKGKQVICTEKDAQKLWAIVPDAVAIPLIQTAEPGFYAALDARINEWMAAKLSSPHGHTTT